MFIIIFEHLSFLILFLVHNPNDTPKKEMITMIIKTGFISILLSVLVSIVGISHIESYLPYEFIEIDVHYESSLSAQDYLEGNNAIVMDKEHNIYNIDIDNCEVRWCKDIYGTRVYKKVYNISPVLRVLFPSNRYTDQYIIEFYDYYGTDIPICGQ